MYSGPRSNSYCLLASSLSLDSYHPPALLLHTICVESTMLESLQVLRLGTPITEEVNCLFRSLSFLFYRDLECMAPILMSVLVMHCEILPPLTALFQA